MWKLRHLRQQPRNLGEATERAGRGNRDPLWLVERKLRHIVAKWPDQPAEWADILTRWVDRHQDGGRVWDLVEAVLADWSLDPDLDSGIKTGVLALLESVPEWRHEFPGGHWGRVSDE